MKLWEVLKELEENPEKVFKSNNGFGEVTLEYSNGIKFIGIQKTRDGSFLSEIRDWQEIKQPVTWQEAIEAWADGDTVKCVLGKSESVFFGEKIAFRNQDASVIDKVQIREGAWYIED